MSVRSTDQSVHASIIKDISLAPEGHKKLEWARRHMPVLSMLKEGFEKTQPLKGKTIMCVLHLEAKTGYLLQTLKAAGAIVVACASNPLSTQDDVVAGLVDTGITVYALYGESLLEYEEYLNIALDSMPDAIIDDGADAITTVIKQRPDQALTIIGGCEETTTGIVRLRAMEEDGALPFPMIAVNDAYMKYLFDNRYGTGQSVWDGINRTTNLVVAGKNVVVAGYGWCGKGVSLRGKGMGANIIVTEIDPVKANEAIMDGYKVMPMAQAAELGDIFITVTGNVNVVRKEHMLCMRDGAIMCNAGHFDVEISKPDLNAISISQRPIRANTEEYVLEDGRKLYLLAEGRLVNLAAGDGHPAEVMDLSFSLQALSLMYVVQNHHTMENKVYNVPQDIDRQVAFLKLQADGVAIDQMTDEQLQYLTNWDTNI